MEVGDDGERSRIVANSTSALYVGSPALSDGYVVDGGFFRRDTRSLAACVTKSSNVVAGNGIEWGKFLLYPLHGALWCVESNR